MSFNDPYCFPTINAAIIQNWQEPNIRVNDIVSFFVSIENTLQMQFIDTVIVVFKLFSVTSFSFKYL